VTWHETASETFVARHDHRDTPEAEQILRTLEGARVRFQRQFGVTVDELAIVLHSTEAQLDAAAPPAAIQRRLTTQAGRRYVVGWAGTHELHVLAPRVLATRASNVEGSLEMLMLSPTALLVRRVVMEANPLFTPPWGARTWLRYARWAWMLEGAAQYFSGQADYARPLIGRRLREGSAPDFPPGRADAPLLGGSIFDLLCREEGDGAGVRLAKGDLADTPQRALERAFHGRSIRHTEGTWRAHLSRMAEGRLPARRQG
jgi:hypothetical protein